MQISLNDHIWREWFLDLLRKSDDLGYVIRGKDDLERMIADHGITVIKHQDGWTWTHVECEQETWTWLMLIHG